jgi:hypothetical protein
MIYLAKVAWGSRSSAVEDQRRAWGRAAGLSITAAVLRGPKVLVPAHLTEAPYPFSSSMRCTEEQQCIDGPEPGPGTSSFAAWGCRTKKALYDILERAQHGLKGVQQL